MQSIYLITIILLLIIIMIMIMVLVKKSKINSESYRSPKQYVALEPYDNIQLIPKIIHQTGPYPIPRKFIPNIKKIVTQNPEYKYKYWSDDDIDKYLNTKCSKEEYNAYHKINPKYGAARADFFRYIIVRDQGGIYLDLKSNSSVPFREIIKPNDTYLLSSWSDNSSAPHDNILYTGFGEFMNWFIISIPNHDFLKQVVKNVVHNINNYKLYPTISEKQKYNYPDKMVGKIGVLHLTGPIIYTNTIKNMLTPRNHQFKYNSYDGQLQYSTLKSSTNFFEHSKHFGKKHYSEITEPIVIA